MVAAVESAMEAETIGQLRESYQQISQELIKAVENQGYGETLFVQFCPMADGGDGAAWLSRESEINNPYYGDVMLRCGNTLRTIE
jgi:Cu(I)/Ag(I) efflux system membrane fusion protein